MRNVVCCNLDSEGCLCKPWIGFCHEPDIRAVQLRPFLGLRKLRSLDAVGLNPPGCLKAFQLCKRSMPTFTTLICRSIHASRGNQPACHARSEASSVRRDMQAFILRTVCSASSNDGRQATGCIVRHLNRMSLSHAQSLTTRAQCVDQPADER